ncbi:FtsK/SpoIIIE domain-containing protein [Streptomyces sp. SP18BB07]|uniref:FtsK/SpoIIIE domain-containing protein n=1 Tax=Streptomyces sp. SP18BB07 TaxID=3002522 RepID=UPI002E75E1B3|nr:FtsK/SpoIIIE domain-containing protein [Streptomyces sp. SP18BB07]MEE1764383.1 FtsK/SpoIIIE domain-containing protein [Streptomyces sp. SP18BB07]
MCGRLRYELIPAAASFGMTCLGWLHHAVGVGWQDLGGYGLGLAATGALTYGGLKFKNKTAASLGVASTGTLVNTAVGAWLGPSVPSLVAGGVITIASYGVYVPWLIKTRHERISLQIKAAKTAPLPDGMGINVSQAGVTGDTEEETALRRALVALGVPAVDVSRIVFTDTGWYAMVTLPPGKNTSAQAVIAKRQQLLANLDLPGRLRLTEGAQANQLIVRMQNTDPLAETVPWPGVRVTSIEQPIPIGIYPDGTEIEIRLTDGHVLVAGGTNKGKSGAVNVLAANLVACDDVALAGIDMKPGALELGPWQRNMVALADDADTARQVLVWLKSEMTRRGRYLATLRGPKGERVKKWTREHGKYIVLIIDELAELLRQAPDVVSELMTLMQVSRAMGIRIVAATQSPSEQAFGGKGTDTRQQFGTRIGLPVNEPTPINMIMGTGAYGKGWRLDELDLPGKTMVSSERHPHPKEGRCYWITEHEIHLTSLHFAPDDGPDTAAAPPAPPEPDPDPEPPNPPGGGGPRGGRPALHVVPKFPDGSRIPDNRLQLWQALEKAGPEGLTKPEAVRLGICNHHTSIGPWLSQWVAKGWVEDADKRDRAVVYVLTAARHTPAPEAPASTEENPACPASL